MKQASYTSRFGVLLAAAIVLTPFLFGTSPLPVYHQYEVSGQLVRTSSGSRANFTAVLLARSSYDISFVRIGSTFPTDFAQDVSLTDTAGHFHLRVRTFLYDSLAVGIVLPDQPVTK